MGVFIRHVTSTGRLSESLLRVPAFTRCNSSEASLQNESALANDIKEEQGYGLIFYSGGFSFTIPINKWVCLHIPLHVYPMCIVMSSTYIVWCKHVVTI